jgi:2,4-dienoyl-CoA reductase (NADPH2)
MYERFKYKSRDDLLQKANDLGLKIPYSDDLTPLFRPASVAGIRIDNRFVVQPMEGYDSEDDGSPSALTERRYLRYASGGSGIIWFEAVSVAPEGRSNPHQLWIKESNADSFSRLNEVIRKTAAKKGKEPLLVLQITHSGRYSRPDGRSKPLVAALNPILDGVSPRLLTDDELSGIQDQFVKASRLARISGFNVIDLKACHGYLLIDLLSARARTGSIYGGEEAERRFRFFLETIDRIKNDVPDIIVTTRLNISDHYPGGFGVDSNGNADFEEPMLLVKELRSRGIDLLNITMGSPYFNPHVSRPYNKPLPGANLPDEHPLSGVMRMIEGTARFQEHFPEILMVGTGYSYLRHHAPNVGAAVLRDGKASFIGFGRNSFAYPSMPEDLATRGKSNPSKFCITCSGCTRLIKNLHPGGCVIHDREIYGNELKKLIADGK